MSASAIRPSGIDGLATPSAFRTAVREWFDEHAPAKGSPQDFSAIHVVTSTTKAEYRARERAALDVTRQWQQKLYDAGLAGRSWPKEYGGAGAPVWQDDVVAEEQSRYGVSTKMMAVALEMVPPVLFVHGTHEQRLDHLPRVICGEETWCQLLSEPGAGSDLASVSTLATPVDGGWSVTGQKVWTSGAGSSDHALLIARTDRSVPGRGGLSCFAMPMAQPGVDVRPLRQMSGAYHFNEVFLDEAFVSKSRLIGELGGGWAVLRTMLRHERAAIGGGTSGRGRKQRSARSPDRGGCRCPRAASRSSPGEDGVGPPGPCRGIRRQALVLGARATHSERRARAVGRLGDWLRRRDGGAVERAIPVRSRPTHRRRH